MLPSVTGTKIKKVEIRYWEVNSPKRNHLFQIKLALYFRNESCFIVNKSTSVSKFSSFMKNIKEDFNAYINTAFV